MSLTKFSTLTARVLRGQLRYLIMGQNERQIKIVLDRGGGYQGEDNWGAGLLSPPAVVIDDLP